MGVEVAKIPPTSWIFESVLAEQKAWIAWRSLNQKNAPIAIVLSLGKPVGIIDSRILKEVSHHVDLPNIEIQELMTKDFLFVEGSLTERQVGKKLVESGREYAVIRDGENYGVFSLYLYLRDLFIES